MLSLSSSNTSPNLMGISGRVVVNGRSWLDAVSTASGQIGCNISALAGP